MVDKDLEYGRSYYLGADVSNAKDILTWLKDIGQILRSEVPLKTIPQLSIPDIITTDAWMTLLELQSILATSSDKFIWTVSQLHVNESENTLAYNSAFVHETVLAIILRLFYKSCGINGLENEEKDGHVFWGFEFLDSDLDPSELNIAEGYFE